MPFGLGKQILMKSIFFCFLLICPAFAFAQKSVSSVHLLASWSVGQFDNALQAKEAKGYFDLQVNTVQIWKGRRDGYWLYSEEAGVDHLTMPHRQRVYRYYVKDSALVREEYLIPNSRQYAGAHKFKKPLDYFSPEDLSKREGCNVHYIYDSLRFIGRTVGVGCPSEIGGVAYSVTELEITSDLLKNWDRGFNDRSEVVWGATAPYEFRKKEPYDIARVRLRVDQEIVAIPSVPVAAPVQVIEPVPMILVEPIPKPDSIHAPPPAKAELKDLALFMSGHFETRNQTADGKTFTDIRLDVLPIWNKKKDGYWLYAEEARADQKEVTYQQQVYHLHMVGTLFVLDTYTIKSPVQYEGTKGFKKALRELRQDSLELVKGCEVYFRFDSARFLGQTNRLHCPPRIAGAASGYREIQIDSKEMKYTDHGYSLTGEVILTGLGPFVYYRKPERD